MPDHFIVACCNTIHCYSRQSNSFKLKWLSQSGGASAMALVGSRHLITGEERGWLTLYDWTETQVSVFSMIPSPKRLKAWFSYEGLDLPISLRFILHIHVNTNLGYINAQSTLSSATSSSSSSSSSSTWHNARLTWVSASGWVFSTMIDLTAITMSLPATIIWKSNPVRFIKPESGAIVTIKQRWSMPQDIVCVSGSDSRIVLERVADAQQVLRHPDPYSLHNFDSDTGPTVDPCLLYVHLSRLSGISTNTIQLKKITGNPKVLAVHPSQQWIVVETRNNHLAIVTA
jgi:hypothetical protein